MNPTHPELLDLDEYEPCEVYVDAPMNPLGEMCQNVRGANGTVKNEQAKSRRTNNKKKNRKKGANKRAASASAEEAEDEVKKAKHVQPDEWVVEKEAAELCRCSVEQWVEYSWKEQERRLLAELWEYAEDCDMHLFEDEPEDEMSEASDTGLVINPGKKSSRDTGLVIERMRLAIPSHFLSRFSFACFACSFCEIPWCCMYNNTQDTSEGQSQAHMAASFLTVPFAPRTFWHISPKGFIAASTHTSHGSHSSRSTNSGWVGFIGGLRTEISNQSLVASGSKLAALFENCLVFILLYCRVLSLIPPLLLLVRMRLRSSRLLALSAAASQVGALLSWVLVSGFTIVISGAACTKARVIAACLELVQVFEGMCIYSVN
jgi:hypothetical protein